MYTVYRVTDQGGKPIIFSQVAANLTKREANTMARSIRNQGEKAAVYTGSRVKSCF